MDILDSIAAYIVENPILAPGRLFAVVIYVGALIVLGLLLVQIIFATIFFYAYLVVCAARVFINFIRAPAIE